MRQVGHVAAWVWLVSATCYALIDVTNANTQPCRTESLDPIEQKKIKDMLTEYEQKLASIKGRTQRGVDIIDKWKTFSSEATTFADQVGIYIEECRGVDKSLADAEAAGQYQFRVPNLKARQAKCREEANRLTSKLLWYQKEMQLIGNQIKDIEGHIKDIEKEAEGVSREKRLLELQTSVDSLVNELGRSIERLETGQCEPKRKGS